MRLRWLRSGAVTSSWPASGNSGAVHMPVLPIHNWLICVPRLTNGYLSSRHSYSALGRVSRALELIFRRLGQRSYLEVVNTLPRSQTGMASAKDGRYPR
jgi:hypothetical protein